MLPSGLPLSGITVLLARTAPAEKLIVEACASTPEGKTRRSPGLVGITTVTLAATASASAGTPHWPASAKVRLAPPMAGPPKGPGAWRVSTARQGGRVK